MIILYIIGIIIVIAFINMLVNLGKDFKQCYNEVIAEEREKQRRTWEEIEKEIQEQDELKNKKNELYKQLEAVQYQLKLLERLDDFRSDELHNEKEVTKSIIFGKAI